MVFHSFTVLTRLPLVSCFTKLTKFEQFQLKFRKFSFRTEVRSVWTKRKLVVVRPRVATCLTVALQVTAGRPTDRVPGRILSAYYYYALHENTHYRPGPIERKAGWDPSFEPLVPFHPPVSIQCCGTCKLGLCSSGTRTEATVRAWIPYLEEMLSSTWNEGGHSMARLLFRTN